jgi:hypothetical protein
MARKPPGSKLSLEDPYEDKEAAARRRQFILIVILVALVAGAIWVRYNRVQTGHYFWEPAPAAAAAPVAPAEPAK